jgi:UDP:flavonoid glycosyltransferase YjiC (YdhE family)
MRVLAGSTANDGHFGPLVPYLRALAEAGHEVAVAAPASYARALGRAGFRHLPFADPSPEVIGPVMARLPSLSFEEADATVIREVFGRIDALAGLPGVQEAVATWRPDLVIHEPGELASLAAAEVAGVPHAQVVIGMGEMLTLMAGYLREPLAELGALVGLPEDRLEAALLSQAMLSPVPEVLDRAGDPAYRDDQHVWRFRDTTPAPAAGEQALPIWGDQEQPLVYVTFGSVTGSLPPFAGAFREALDALADVPARVLMTVGRQVDPEGLGTLPPNARVERWWPQAEVLAEASAVLGHGGFGTTLGAVSAGVPQVVAPLFTADQRINGRHVAATGAGRSVEAGVGVVARAAAEVRVVLDDAAYAEAARALSGAIADLPPVSDAVRVLEGLVG